MMDLLGPFRVFHLILVKDLFGPCNLFLFVLFSVRQFGWTMAKRAPDLVQIKIRMPRALHQKLTRDAARTTAHTINAEIVKRLEASYQPDTLREDIAEIKQAQTKLSREIMDKIAAHTINAEIVKRLEASYQPDTLREDIAEIKQAQTKLSSEVIDKLAEYFRLRAQRS
jgi:hypothetical protein